MPTPNKYGDSIIIAYDPDSDEDGEVLWDGEAEGLGIPHLKTLPRPDDLKNVDFPADEDLSRSTDPVRDAARRKRLGR